MSSMDFSVISDYLKGNGLLTLLFIFLVCLIVFWIIFKLFKKNPSEVIQDTSIQVQEEKVEELKKEVLPQKPIAKDLNVSGELLPELKTEKEQKQKMVSFHEQKFQQVVWPRITPQIVLPSEPKSEEKHEEVKVEEVKTVSEVKEVKSLTPEKPIKPVKIVKIKHKAVKKTTVKKMKTKK